MAFEHDLRAFAEQAAAKTKHISTEEATKSALIVPFLRVLGYDDANPTEVIPEHAADVGDKKDWKVDYALCPVAADPRPAIIIECKSWQHEPTEQHVTQLGRYFPFTTARFGILTNGLTYQFYTDVTQPNNMEKVPFLEIDLTQLSETAIQELERFTKAQFQLDQAVARAEQLHYTRVVHQQFAAYYTTPDEAWVGYFADQVTDKRNTPALRRQFTPIVHEAFHQFVNAQIVHRLTHQTRGLAPLSSAALPAPDPALPDDRATDTKIITTEEEVHAWYLIKAILRERVAPERVTMRDVQRYCSILLDDNRNKRLCLLWFNNPEKKAVSVFDADKTERKVAIQSLDDLYQLTDALLAAVARHDQPT